MDSDGAEPGEMTPDGQKRKTGASLSNTDRPEPARLAGTGQTDLKIAGLGDPARGVRIPRLRSGIRVAGMALRASSRSSSRISLGDTPDRCCSMLSA